MSLAVFVYGTLKPGGSAWARLCEGKVAAQRPARVRGRLFLLTKTGYPAMVVEAGSREQGSGSTEPKTRNPKPETRNTKFETQNGRQSWVKGWLLKLRDAGALCAFDKWEEYDESRQAERNVYQRVMIECFAEDAGPSAAPQSLGRAWAYVMAPARIKELGRMEIAGGEWPPRAA